MSLVSLIIFLFILIAIYEVASNLQRGVGQTQKVVEKEGLPYKKKPYFFTISERKFFDILQSVINNKYIIFSKVRIVDLLDVPKGLENPDFYKRFNKIKSKHVDFVICDKEKLAPLLVIELDDSTHSKPNRIKRDEFVDQSFQSAGLPILHVRNSVSYNRDELFQSLSNYLKPVVG